MMELHNLRSEVPEGSAALARVRRLQEMAEESCIVVRDMSRLLRPSILDDLGLVPALNWQAREVGRRTGMEIAVHADDTCNILPDDYRTCIYRVTQETLNNASRHAKAAHVQITVRLETAQIRLVVQDDGRGFDSRHQKGVGLLGMEERVRSLGGAIHIDSRQGGGARISVLLPVPHNETAIPENSLHFVAAS
jgi:signal transduction histidine kinase